MQYRSKGVLCVGTVEWLKVEEVWLSVKDAARTTINKDKSEVYPTDEWKKRILLAEHSPVRKIKISWKWRIKYWVSVHFVRHKFGIEHWVGTQRSDRTGNDRDSITQDAIVSHECEANPQALINISRKRLCNCASAETRQAWQDVKDAVAEQDKVLASVMVRECVYRGFCPEFTCCGYVNTPAYQKELEEYRSVQQEIGVMV